MTGADPAGCVYAKGEFHGFSSIEALEAGVTHRALQQSHDVPALLAFPDQAKYRIQSRKVRLDELRDVLRAHIHARAREVSFGEHLLGDERLIGERLRGIDGKRSERRQTTGGDGEAMLLRKTLPAGKYTFSDARDSFPGARTLHDFERLERSRGPDAFGPKRAADKRRLRSLHDLAPADHGGNGVAVAERLAEHRHVRLDTVRHVQTAIGLAEARG